MADETTKATSRKLKSIQSADAASLADYYDDWARSYDKDLEDLGYEAPLRAAGLLKAHGMSATAPILDACCGTGLTGRRLAEAGFEHVDGFDISEASLDEARTVAAYDGLFRQDMNDPLQAPDGAYDAVVCIGSMTYAERPEQLLREFCRVARPGGIVLFTQRTDYWSDDFAGILHRLEEAGLWQWLEKTEPQPYLPRHPEFADAIKVVYAVFRVV
ncbi:class I SAM-dependent DNA methyltransferase [Microbaculum sp. FT89]|uniref:class I SAM-dependent DNA methyltransferase n=1 Tax=Microbaculum sp. FT89 TaxID=3447298 RepID=UPI003F532943